MVSEEKENHTSMLNLVMGNLERERALNKFSSLSQMGRNRPLKASFGRLILTSRTVTLKKVKKPQTFSSQVLKEFDHSQESGEEECICSAVHF